MPDKQASLSTRKRLDHTAHFHGRFGAMYFVTVCCRARGMNQLCEDETAQAIFETARRYHAAARWYLYLLLLMPDHMHALLSISGDSSLSSTIRDFKRITAKTGKILWQRNFFDHRLRHDESLAAKAAYIRDNPSRAGFVKPDAKWPFIIELTDLEA